MGIGPGILQGSLGLIYKVSTAIFTRRTRGADIVSTWGYGQAFFKGHCMGLIYRVSSVSVSSYAYMFKAITKAIK